MMKQPVSPDEVIKELGVTISELATNLAIWKAAYRTLETSFDEVQEELQGLQMQVAEQSMRVYSQVQVPEPDASIE